MSLIRRSVSNPVAANMLMILILGGGIAAAFVIPRELFPEFSIDRITVTVPYRGASPEDVERSICLKIEEKIEGIEGIDEINSVSREDVGIVSVVLQTDADVRKVLDEIKSEVDKIDFPADAEDPIVVELTMKRHVIHVAVAGDVPEQTLKALAEEVRDDLAELPEISQVTVSGVRDFEIAVELSEESLRKYQITLGQIAQAIRDNSFDLPAGTIRTTAGELAIRVVGQRNRADEYRNIVVMARPNGTVVRLSEVANIREDFEDINIAGRFNGMPSALVSVYKTSREDAIEIAAAVRKYVADKQDQLPEGVVLEPWSDLSKFVGDRLRMLTRNGLWGLAMVLLVLWVFLGLRLSFWVALGIPVSILGTILVLELAGFTMNMMSMFALIMVLGLIVDDAIVVGENVYSHIERGDDPIEAAVEGTRNVLVPVIGAVVTTWLAFAPLALLPGMMGKFMQLLPICVITALAFSLVECLLILPPHLAGSLKHRPEGDHVGNSVPARMRRKLDAAISRFINGPFARVSVLTSRYRYVTIVAAVGVMVVVATAVKSGVIELTPMPKNSGDTIMASVVMPTGTPFSRTREVAKKMTRAVQALNDRYRDDDGGPVVQRVYTLLGQQVLGGASGSHVADVIVELAPSETRSDVDDSDILIKQWRADVGQISDALSLRFTSLRGGPSGKPISIRLLSDSARDLEIASARLRKHLRTLPGVDDVEDDALEGRMEMKVRLKDGADNMGVSLRLLANQLRDAFYGNESLTIQRGRDEMKVMVRYPAASRRSLADVEAMRIRTLDGSRVPFAQVADVWRGRGPASLRRAGGKKIVTISADVDSSIANAEKILAGLQEGFFEKMLVDLPGTKIDLLGQREQMMESLGALKVWFPLSLLGMYTLLAGIFKSYIQPVIIMLAIPFGLAGAVAGHWVMGFDLTMLSMFGMVALTGIVVNDSLVLIDLLNRKVRAGGTLLESVGEAARQRFRPIILTSITTVAGMAPILLERSFQAQFLKPMVVSIAFGLTFATVLTLLVVPCLYLVGNDMKRCWHWLRHGDWPNREAVVNRAMQTPSPPDGGK